MAYWSLIGSDNIVVQTTITSNDEPDEGYQWLMDNFGGRWIKTSYNTHGGRHLLGGVPVRMNFGIVGSYYDEERDVFIPPKPEDYPDWILDNKTLTWVPPVPPPPEGFYVWLQDEHICVKIDE